MERGAVQFSTGTLVIAVLSIAIIVSGVYLIQSLEVELPSFEKGMPQFFDVDVTPEQAQEGTVFKIDVDFADDALVYFAQANIVKDGIIGSIPLYDDGSHGDKKKGDMFYSGVFNSDTLEEGLYKIDIVINPSESQIKYENVSEFVVYKDNCIPLVYNGDPEEKIDVAILAVDYNDFDKFKKDALKLIGLPERHNGILTYEPLKSNANKFNFYMLNQSVDLRCVKGCYGVESLVCCSNERVFAAASQCPADNIIILVDSQEFCGSASSYAKICNGWNLGQVGTHEFSHIFGGLGDEYVYEEVYPGYDGIITNYPNCDVEECPKWSAYWPNCVEGCGVSVRSRPTEEDCIMYTYVDEYDVVDKNHLTKLLNNYETGEVLEIAAPPLEKTFLVELNYNKGELSTNAVYATQSKAPDRKALRNVDYFAKIVNFNGRTLETFKFEFPRVEWPAMPSDTEDDSHSPVVVDETNHTILANYYKDASKMEIYDLENNKLLTIDLSYLAESCGDGVCQAHESFVECQEDCLAEQVDDICTYTKDDVCDPDCRQLDPDCGLEKENLYLILGAVVAALIVVGALMTPKKRK